METVAPDSRRVNSGYDPIYQRDRGKPFLGIPLDRGEWCAIPLALIVGSMMLHQSAAFAPQPGPR
jgi:hypothetical protein